MKRSAKLLALLVSAIIIVSALVIAASASDAPDFKVGDKTYDSWSEAVTAAGGTEIIYLNDDITQTALSGFAVSSDARVDLNGHTITMPAATANDNNNGAVFTISAANVSFELLGEGTVRNGGRLINPSSADVKNLSVKINAYGDGIHIDRVGPAANNGSSHILLISEGSDYTVSGKIHIDAYTPSVMVFSLTAGTSLDDLTTLELSGADITVYPKWLENNRYIFELGMSEFVRLDKYTKTTINNSRVDMIDGNGFSVNTSTYKTAKLDQTTDTANFEELTSFIEGENSSILTRTGGCRLTVNTSMGLLFNFATAPVEVRFTNCTLMGASRTTNVTANKGTNINPQRFYFTNVDYVGDPEVLYGSTGFTYGNLNMIWNGGKIRVTMNNGTKFGAIFYEQYKAAYEEYYKQDKFVGTADYGKTLSDANLRFVDTADELFGEIAKLAATKDVEVTNKNSLVIYNAAGKKVSIAKDAKFMPSDPNGDGDKSDSILFTMDQAWMNNPEYICSYVDWNNALIYSENSITTTSFMPNNVSYPYAEVKNGDTLVTWYGIKMSNVLFDLTNAPATTNAILEGTKYTNVWIEDDGIWKKYSTAYLDSYTEPTAPENSGKEGPVEAYTTVFNPLNAYSTWATATGTASEGTVAAWQSNYRKVFRAGISYNNMGRFGGFEFIPEAPGQNGYVKYEVTADMQKYQESQAYVEIAAPGYGSLKTVADTAEGAYGKVINTEAPYKIADYKYIVQEFDIWTDTAEYTAGGVNYIHRFIRPYYNTTDKVYTTETKQNQGNTIFNLYSDGKFYMNDISGSAKSYMLPLDGTAARVTFIIELVINEVKYDLQVSETETLKDRRGYTANNSLLHIFIDGNYVGTSTRFASATVMDEAVIDTWGLDAIRFQFPGDNASFENHKGSSLCFDNFYLAHYKSTNEMAEVIKRAIDTKSIAEGECFNYHGGHIVDGVRYSTEAEAIAALKSGSTIELDSDLKTVFSAPENLKIVTNGYSYTGIVSSQRVFEYEGTVYMLPAVGDESVDVKYESSAAGISETKPAGIGTVIESPVDLSEYGTVNVGGEDTYIIGWTLTEGEDDIFVDGTKATAYPVFGVANVSWTDGAGAVIKTEKYRPDSYPTLPEDLTYDLSGTAPGNWYNYTVTGWQTALATKLTNGDNTLSPDITASAPTGTIEDVKIGLSLYSYYELNIYLPEFNRARLISDVRITEGGAILGKRLVVNSSNKPTGEGWTIGGVAYEKYYINIGVSETRERTYLVSYEVAGTEITREIKYAVPYYASQIMADNNQSKEAKTLVVNMANYALATIALTGEEADTRIYEGIVRIYGDEYLGGFTALSDERFAASDNAETEGVTNDIYNAEIKDLNYKTAEFAKYVESASFFFSSYEPAFAIKYSDAAKQFAKADGTVIGVKVPASNGTISYHKVGVWTYFQYGTSGSTFGYHYAYDASGNKVAISSGSDASLDYYAFSFNPYSTSDRYYSNHNLRNINEIINMKVYTLSVLANNNANHADSDLKGEDLTYSLAAYIAGMIEERDETSAALAAASAEGTNPELISSLTEELLEYEKTITAAKALYAYSDAAKAYR